MRVRHGKLHGQGCQALRHFFHVAAAKAGIDKQRLFFALHKVHGVAVVVLHIEHARADELDFIAVKARFAEHPLQRFFVLVRRRPRTVRVRVVHVFHFARGILRVVRVTVAGGAQRGHRHTRAHTHRAVRRVVIARHRHHGVVFGMERPHRHIFCRAQLKRLRIAANRHGRRDLMRVAREQLPRARAAHGNTRHVQAADVHRVLRRHLQQRLRQ